jgi:uncharacterized protein YjiS (DUF1127 family)
LDAADYGSSLKLICRARNGVRRPIRAALAEWQTRRRERAELAQMTPAELRDARLTTYEAQTEARKPFWRA